MRHLLILTALSVLLLLAGCGRDAGPSHEAANTQEVQSMGERRPIDEVLRDHDQEILAIPGVSMIYVGVDSEGEPCLKVGVVQATPEVEERIPKTLEGWPVLVEETGEVRPMN